MKEPLLTSAEQIFDALGGASAIAEMTGATPKAVTNWKYFNAFPSRTYLVLTVELRKRGKRAPASLWKMDEPADREIVGGEI